MFGLPAVIVHDPFQNLPSRASNLVGLPSSEPSCEIQPATRAIISSRLTAGAANVDCMREVLLRRASSRSAPVNFTCLLNVFLLCCVCCWLFCVFVFVLLLLFGG